LRDVPIGRSNLPPLEEQDLRRLAGSGRKRRVNVSLPVELSRRFVTRAETEDRYLTDMVMEAFRDHAANLISEEDSGQRAEVLARRPERRRTSSGRITHMLYLTVEETTAIDDAASRIGMSRSAFTARILERSL